jgi:cytochrome c-type biogenesis protein CcmH/NrfG
MKLGRLPQAVEALETAVRLDPELSNAWINLGEAHMRNRNLGRAIQALEKAIALAPTAMDARMFLAQSYLGARLPVKSREQAEKMLTTQANFTPALGMMTMAYLMEGNATAASAPYLKLKTLAPAIARTVRDQAIAGGLVTAAGLPD